MRTEKKSRSDNPNYAPEVMRYIAEELDKNPCEKNASDLGHAFALCITRNTKGQEGLVVDNTMHYPLSENDEPLVDAFWDKVKEIHTFQLFGVVLQQQRSSSQDIINGIEEQRASL